MPNRRFARLGPSRAPTFHRLSTSTASLHVAPTADPRRSSILGKSSLLRHGTMSALGQKPTCAPQNVMSASPPKADMCAATRDVRFGPKADIGEQAPKLVFRGPCCKPFNASAMALSRLGWRSVAACMGRCHRAPSPRASEGGRSRQSPLECCHHWALSSAYLSRSLGGSYMGTRSAQGTFVANLPL